MIKIKFFGAAREVTGSMHLIEKDGFKILLDCGMQQGKRKESFERNRNFPFNPEEINALILSHAHIDHAGNIPTLISKGFNKKIFTTHPTRDLCEYMLPDSAYVQIKDVEYVNKKRAKQGKTLFEPLYTVEQAKESIRYFVPKNLGEHFLLNDDIDVYFLNAGHILGSAITVLSLKEKDKILKIGFTGDLGRKQLPILKEPDFLTNVDYLIIESTYGGRNHGEIKDAFEKLAKIVNETYDRKGKIIIPVFAVERSQEILYGLNKLYIEKKIPEIPVFMDSPLAINITDVFARHNECFDNEMIEYIVNNENPFYSKLVKYTETVEESKKINDYDKPCIILSATGMCEAGRILHHLKNNIQDQKNVVLFVGYQAENTLGRRLLEGEKKVKIFGESYSVNARIEKINEFSAHAGNSELVNFIKKINQEKLKKIFLVHGEISEQEKLIESLNNEGIKNVYNPELYYEEILE